MYVPLTLSFILYYHFVSSLPFIKEKCSDENIYAPCVIETLSLLGTLIKFESEPLRQQVARAIADFYTAESNQALAEGKMVDVKLAQFAIFLYSRPASYCSNI